MPFMRIASLCLTSLFLLTACDGGAPATSTGPDLIVIGGSNSGGAANGGEHGEGDHGPPPVGSARDTAVTPANEDPVMLAYLQLGEALVQANAETAATAAGALAAAWGEGAPAALASFPAELADQRNAFYELYEPILAWRAENPAAQAGTKLAHCPMAMRGTGGSWVQGETPLRNPYYGDEMLHCGRFVAEADAAEQ